MPYSGDPSTSNADQVRFYAGDTDTTEELLTDSEIEFALVQEGAAIPAAALCLEVLSRKYARQASYSEAGVSEQLAQRSEAFADRARELRAETASTTLQIVTGQDASKTPFFTRDLHDDSPV